MPLTQILRSMLSRLDFLIVIKGCLKILVRHIFVLNHHFVLGYLRSFVQRIKLVCKLSILKTLHNLFLFFFFFILWRLWPLLWFQLRCVYFVIMAYLFLDILFCFRFIDRPKHRILVFWHIPVIFCDWTSFYWICESLFAIHTKAGFNWLFLFLFDFRGINWNRLEMMLVLCFIHNKPGGLISWWVISSVEICLFLLSKFVGVYWDIT